MSEFIHRFQCDNDFSFDVENAIDYTLQEYEMELNMVLSAQDNCIVLLGSNDYEMRKFTFCLEYENWQGLLMPFIGVYVD